MPKPTTGTTLGDAVDAQTSWTKQFSLRPPVAYRLMHKTLQDLAKELSLCGNHLFDADL
ncbi:hypothetical protein M2281_002536 [Mesorhizobium soli]|uniref:hypothetical protein n=1 Tax=Pseudaminobacter soli (ex Li et al. 2025) TaxID=1295366 RepID=UPI002476427B|nr:hypothetical protein [Mesorhizobium soli]MDH6231938.1 hypothetical protein [Mesorhizobium soli]